MAAADDDEEAAVIARLSGALAEPIDANRLSAAAKEAHDYLMAIRRRRHREASIRGATEDYMARKRA